MKCPKCGYKIPKKAARKAMASELAKIKSEKRSAAARENGKKGGRPRKLHQVISGYPTSLSDTSSTETSHPVRRRADSSGNAERP